MQKILSFEVEDTGAGIESEDLKDIFEPFYQSSRWPQINEGAGLRLAICQQIVQLLGDGIHVESKVGQGSLFCFTIRANMAEKSQIEANLPSRRVIGLQAGQPECRILVVEDNVENRKLLNQLLRTVGFTVKEAINGQEAFAEFMQWQPRLIFMDVWMPIINGCDAARQIRKVEGQQDRSPEIMKDASLEPRNLIPHTPIIALTAGVFEKDRTEALAAGCGDFIRKPFRETEIFETLQTHLGVQYIYADDEKMAAARGQITDDDLLSQEALTLLPPELLKNLEQAISQLNRGKISAIIETIDTHNASLAEILASLAKRYKYRDIVTLIRKTVVT